MNPTAVQTFSTTGVIILCLAVAVMALGIFFTLLSWVVGWFTGRGEKPESLVVRGVLKKGTWATVHASGEETFERVRFVGYLRSHSGGSSSALLPDDLSGMVILEDATGKRTLIRAKTIRRIDIAPDAAAKPAG